MVVLDSLLRTLLVIPKLICAKISSRLSLPVRPETHLVWRQIHSLAITTLFSAILRNFYYDIIFSGYFSFKSHLSNKKRTPFDHAIDPSNHVTNRSSGCSPLLNRDYQSLLKMRRTWGKILLRKNIAPSFEEVKEEIMQSVGYSGVRERGMFWLQI